MPLYHVQDSDRPLWVIAANYALAIAQWKELIAAENEGDEAEPEGITLVCEDDELLIYGKTPYFSEPVPKHNV